jgi:putative methionine-R-sulfoxide reductase with GAF domain
MSKQAFDPGVFTMSAILQAPRPAPANRRRRVRQKVHAPAYATFSGASRSEMLDLYEVLDISEVGVAVQCPSPLKIGQQVELCLDLAEAAGQISATARVVWSDPTGRVGLGLPALQNPALHRLREWLFLNAMAAAANAESFTALPPLPSLETAPVRQNYTDILFAASAVQSEAESLGPDLEAVLALVALRSQSLLQASGAAIALAGKDAGTMVCRATAGQSAPPVGAPLQVGSGFSGECVRTGTMLRCEDSETDERVDRESCRALGIRSMLAAPLRSNEKVVGLIEVFAAQPNAFGENGGEVLQRLADTIIAALNRTARVHDSSFPPPSPPKAFSPSPGSILFAQMPEDEEKTQEKDLSADQQNVEKISGIRLPRVQLYLLIAAIPAIFLALGYILAPSIQPWIQEKVARVRGAEHTVLASSHPPTADPFRSALLNSPSDSAHLEQIQDLARKGDPAAENTLGLLYAEGDKKQGIKQDDKEAVRWFTKAAEDNYVPAQSKLGALYWAGRGVPPSLNQAYFWIFLARAAGDKSSKTLAPVLASHMTRAQAASIEQEAEIWYEQHESHNKPQPGR